MNYIHLTISNDDDCLVGAEGWGEYDPSASLDELEQQVADALKKRFPSADIAVDSALNARASARIDGMDDDLVESIVNNIQHDVWESWEWLKAQSNA